MWVANPRVCQCEYHQFGTELSARMASKLQRVTDECDLMERRNNSASVRQEDEYETCIGDVDDSGKVQECAQDSPRMNFQVEPGHFDFMSLSKPNSKPFSSSEQGSRHSSCTDFSGSSTSRRDPTTNESSKIMSTTSTRSNTPRHHVVTPPTPVPRTVIIQPLLSSYTWPEVECMRREAGMELLGRGGFGDVFKGTLPNGNFVAIKFLNEGSRQGDAEFLNEVNLLSTVNHRNLVRLLGYCQEGHHRVLVYEYAEEGDISYHIHGKGDLDWRTRLKISMEAAIGLEYLHTGCSQMIVHRDIKSNNILLTKNLDAKLADFGLSKMRPQEGTSNGSCQIETLVKGTPGYLDPAYSKTGRLDEKSDIYSFGIVLLELITGRHPYRAMSDPSNQIHIKDWVAQQIGGLKLATDAKLDVKLRKLSDPKMNGNFNLKSLRKVFTLALKCADEDPKKRPDIRIVVAQLRAATVNQDETSHASKWSLRSLLGGTNL